MTNPNERQRDTSSTQRRADNMRKLIEKMETTQMTTDEISDMFGFSVSGTRKYLKDLRDSDVIELSHREKITNASIGAPVWKLTDNMVARKAFIDCLGIARKNRDAPKREKNYYGKDPTRHFHVLADDQHYSVKPSRAPAFRDELQIAFFGPAKTNQPESK